MNIPIETIQEKIMLRKKEIQEKRKETTNEYIKSYYDGQMTALDSVMIDLTQYFVDHMGEL